MEYSNIVETVGISLRQRAEGWVDEGSNWDYNKCGGDDRLYGLALS